MSTRTLERLALISYSVYLSHEEVIHVVANQTNTLGLGPVAELIALLAAVFTGSTLVGLAVHHAIERPGMRLRAKFAPAVTDVAA